MTSTTLDIKLSLPTPPDLFINTVILAIFLNGLGWPCPVRLALKNPSQELKNHFFSWVPMNTGIYRKTGRQNYRVLIFLPFFVIRICHLKISVKIVHNNCTCEITTSDSVDFIFVKKRDLSISSALLMAKIAFYHV